MGIAAAAKPLAGKLASALRSAAPAIQKEAMAYINKASQGRVKDLSSAVNYVSSSKGAIAVTSMALAKAGVSPSNYFTDDVMADMYDQDLRALRAKVEMQFSNDYGNIDSKSLIKGDDGAAKDILHLETVAAISRLFTVSSDAGLRLAHVQLRQFLAMEESTLSDTLAIRASARR
jgi:hypothetical protein